MKKVQKLAQEIKEFANNSCGSSYIEDELIKILDKHLPPIEKPFPKHMYSKQHKTLIYFIIEECGYCINPGSTSNKKGRYSDDWRMEFFEDCDVQRKED